MELLAEGKKQRVYFSLDKYLSFLCVAARKNREMCRRQSEKTVRLLTSSKCNSQSDSFPELVGYLSLFQISYLFIYLFTPFSDFILIGLQ